MRDLHFPGRSPVLSAHGMAATSMPQATLAALDVLRAGGNALDAAIAAVAVLCVVEPMSTGLGGDCFCLYAPARQRRVVALNGSGRAPGAAGIDFFEAKGITEVEHASAHAVTVPGAVSAWEKLLNAHGTKGLDELLRPAIAYAEDGFFVSSVVGQAWAAQAEKLRRNQAYRFLPGGKPPAFGDRFLQPELAATLRAIAREGSRAFYEGPVAEDMVAALNRRGGLHTLEDFAVGRSAAHFVEPIRIGWNGFEVWQCPPNGHGVVVLMILGMLGGFGPVPDGPLGVTRWHRHIEAALLAYRDRDAFVADPLLVDVPVAKLTSPVYLDGLRRLIRDDAAMAAMPAPGETGLDWHRDTVYLSVVDRDGNACSFINSLFEGFGSGILAERSGVMLHNRGFGFRLERGHPNCIAPLKRPLHTIIPGMVTRDGEAVMPYGVMGGHYQPMGQTSFLANHFDYGLDLQESLDLPRLFPFKGRLQVERSVPEALVRGLARLGHVVEPVERAHGGGQAIWIDRARGCLVGASDPRKDGCALGY